MNDTAPDSIFSPKEGRNVTLHERINFVLVQTHCTSKRSLAHPLAHNELLTG